MHIERDFLSQILGPHKEILSYRIHPSRSFLRRALLRFRPL